MSLWEKLSDVVEPYSPGERSATCDSCSNEVGGVFWCRSQNNNTFDLCMNCAGSEDTIRSVLKKNKVVESIDRRNYSEAEKPVRWPCSLCSNRMGGGHQWWTVKKRGATVNQVDADVCVDCIDKTVADRFTMIKPHDDWYTVERTWRPVLVGLGDADGEVEPPEEYASQMRTIEELVSYLKDLCEYSVEMGSLKNWLPFGNEYEWKFQGITTGFLMDCSEGEGRGRVASYLYDNHGRLGINLAYDTIAEFEAALKEFLEIEPCTDERVLELRKEFTIESADLYTTFAMSPDGFSGYVRTIKDMVNYYG